MFQKHGEFSLLGAFADMVDHHNGWKIKHRKAQFFCPITQVHIFHIHIKSLIQKPYLLEHLSLSQKAGAGDPIHLHNLRMIFFFQKVFLGQKILREDSI